MWILGDSSGSLMKFGVWGMVNRMHFFCWIFDRNWLILSMILGCMSWRTVFQDGDLPVAGVLQSSLDMYGSKVGNEVEEDADVKAGCVTLIFCWLHLFGVVQCDHWFVHGPCSLWLCDVIILNSQDTGPRTGNPRSTHTLAMDALARHLRRPCKRSLMVPVALVHAKQFQDPLDRINDRQ